MKYIGLSTSATQSTNLTKMKRKSENKALSYLIRLIIGSLPMFIFIYISNKSIYSKLYDALKWYPQFHQVGQMFFLMNVTVFSLFYIVGFIGTGMYIFSRTEEIELLLTLPIRKRTLTLYNLIVSLSSQLFTLVFFLATVFGYINGWKVESIDFILRTLIQLFFISSISLLFAVLGGGLSSKSFVKKLNVIITLLLVFVYFGFSYFQRIDVSKLGENQNIARWLSFTTSKYNVLTWAYSSNNILLTSSIFISVFATILFWYFADKVIYENTQKSSKRISNKELMAKESFAAKAGVFLWKDIKLLQRNEQFIFLILYPAAFGIFMMFVSNSVISSSMPFLVISVFYCAMESGILTMDEFKYKELLYTLPVKQRTVIVPKLLVPVLLNTLLLVLINIIAFLFHRYNKLALIFLPFSILLFILSALIGAYYSLSKPGKGKNQPFSTSAVFLIEGFTISLAFGVLFPLTYIFSDLRMQIWQIILSWTSLIGTTILSAVLIYVYLRKLRKITNVQ
jgi:ABC-2 type transport system permease protein